MYNTKKTDVKMCLSHIVSSLTCRHSLAYLLSDEILSHSLHLHSANSKIKSMFGSTIQLHQIKISLVQARL